jgi:glutamate synthase (NADPH) small chain
MGIEISTGLKVGKDITLSQLTYRNDAVLIATGSKDAVKLDTPGIDLKGDLRWISIPGKRIR